MMILNSQQRVSMVPADLGGTGMRRSWRLVKDRRRQITLSWVVHHWVGGLS